MKRRLPLLIFKFMVVGLLLGAGQGALKAGESSETVAVDKVVAHPDKFKGPVNVAGRVAKIGVNGLFALSCEDACVAMPVKFSGAAPAVGANVVVRGQVIKEASGRYVFNAENVTTKK